VSNKAILTTHTQTKDYSRLHSRCSLGVCFFTISKWFKAKRWWWWWWWWWCSSTPYSLYSLHPTTLISSRLTSLRGKRNKARNISWEWDWIMSRMLERFGVARKSLSFVSATPHPLCQDSQRGFYSWRSCSGIHTRYNNGDVILRLTNKLYSLIIACFARRCVCVCEAAQKRVESRCAWAREGWTHEQRINTTHSYELFMESVGWINLINT